MKFQRTKWIFRAVSFTIAIFLLIVIVIYIWLMLDHPEIVPATETYGSFWIKNFSIVVAALAFATTALATAYNALEQRHLRFMENYPYLAIFPILAVDTLPLPVPKTDIPTELETFNTDYLEKVAPSHRYIPSEIEFRYLALTLRNVGHGFIKRVTIKGVVEIPDQNLPSVEFRVDRRFNLSPGDTLPFTLLPISGLPGYKVTLKSVRYSGHFVELTSYEGHSEFSGEHPFDVPLKRRESIFQDDFFDWPAGQGWVLDFWGQWKPTDYVFVRPPTQDQHYLVLSGDERLFSEIHHVQNQGGACKDLMKVIAYGQTVKITVRVRSTPGTNASMQIWCHDIAPNPKNRYTAPITPNQDWHELSMLYTSTHTSNIRVHLLYSPGSGEIHVDRVNVEALHT